MGTVLTTGAPAVGPAAARAFPDAASGSPSDAADKAIAAASAPGAGGAAPA
jgi:hypothetical protein